ncbi:MAG: hypothetical protein BWY21_00467 [Parcubacteria group bacterium ADurb.Bin216]|nr:MAG: hypothetical protein BWY21_00467 [Parcubacteria group bacterium ADurb.Bin216]
MKDSAFSLVEMVVVTGIVALLSTILYVNFSNDSKYEADLTKARAFAVSIPLSMPTAFVSEWKFDGPTAAGSSAVAADLKDTWSANDGTPSATAPTIREGKDCVSGKCLEFNGSNNYVDVGDDASLKGMSSLTIEAWIKGISYKQYAGIVSKWVYNSQMHYYFGYFSEGSATNLGRIAFGVSPTLTGTTVAESVVSTTNLQLNRWYHVVAVFKGGNSIAIYINGNKDNFKTVTTTTIPVGVYNTTIGKYSNYYFNGLIDQVHLYKDALTVSQIQDSYYAGLDSLYDNGVITAEEYQIRKGFCLADSN